MHIATNTTHRISCLRHVLNEREKKNMENHGKGKSGKWLNVNIIARARLVSVVYFREEEERKKKNLYQQYPDERQ